MENLKKGMLVLFALAAIASCKKDESSATIKKLMGSWELLSKREGGSAERPLMFIVFNSEDTGYIFSEETGQTEYVEYEVSGKKIIVDEEDEYTIKDLTDNSLVLAHKGVEYSFAKTEKALADQRIRDWIQSGGSSGGSGGGADQNQILGKWQLEKATADGTTVDYNDVYNTTGVWQRWTFRSDGTALVETGGPGIPTHTQIGGNGYTIKQVASNRLTLTYRDGSAFVEFVFRKI